MRVLLVDHESPTHEQLAHAVRDLCQLNIVNSPDLCLEKLRAEEFHVAIVCDRIANGTGLDLLMLVAQRHPEVMRAFAADTRRLKHVSGRLGRYNVLESVRYPLVPSELRALLKSAQAVQDANADTSNMQHIVLEGDSPVQNESVRMDSRLEIAPEWRPDEAALTQPKPDPKQALAEFETPHWTVEGSPHPTPPTPSGRNIAPSNKLAAIRGDGTPNEQRSTPHLRAVPSHPSAIQSSGANERSANPASGVGATQRNAGQVLGLGSPNGEQSARFGVGAPQHMAHARAMQEAAISDTNALPPKRTNSRRVVVVLTRDKECLDVAIASLAGRAVSILHAPDEDNAVKALRKHGAIAVLVDVGIVNGSARRFLERICAVTDAPVIAVGGRASDTMQIAPLLTSGTVQRFLVKPMNRIQTRTAFAAVLEMPADNDPTVPRDSVPFASIIDRVAATDLRIALKNESWSTRVMRLAKDHWHWVVGGAVLGVSAMMALVLALSG